MGFKDVLKKSFWEQMAVSDITTQKIVVTLVIAGLLGLYIYGVYRVVTKRSFYSKSFNISLVIMALITAAIIVAVQSSVVISLGMVGALSIVRFRTAVKDPMDLVFLFWSISVGIICGAGLFETAVILSVASTVFLIFLELLPVARASMILVVNAGNMDVEQEILEVVKKYTRNFKIKSRNLTQQGVDIVVELRVKDGGEMVKSLGQLSSVSSVSLLSHDGEVTF